MRVTDLEKFSLEQIWRPYQTLMGFGEPRLMWPPFGLDETARLLSQPSDWSAAVLSRLHAIGVTFPSYIKHPLVDVVKGSAAGGRDGE